MPFALKNAGGTYQHLANKIFEPLFGSSIEVYVDDMIVKSKQDVEHSGDLQRMFESLWTYGIRLNSKKCVFGVRLGKFLSFMISSIDANLDKVKAVLDMKTQQNIKEV